MDKIKSMVFSYKSVIAVLETLGEVEFLPESTVYVAMGSNYDASQKLIGVLTKSNAVKVKGHKITKSDAYDLVLANARKNLATIEQLLKDKGTTL